MENEEEEKKAEIIIVRRNGSGHDDEHHGGVWKIAYADFMTAMMAFFLVMWLVNVASEDAKQAMANYFNPIKLKDQMPQKRDLQNDPDAIKEPAEQEIEQEAGQSQKNTAKNQKPSFDEDIKMLNEPYGALETIALLDQADGYREENIGSENGGQQPSVPMSAPRDPFAPQNWQANPEMDELVSETKEEEISGKKEEDTEKLAAEIVPEDDAEITPEIKKIAHIVADDAQELMQQVMQGHDAQEKPQMEVHAQDDGIVIELTDTQNYGMFAVGSAKPETHIVDLLEGLAKIIAKYPGDVIISGYTDARPYRNTAHYDNWQLSAARAQMAHYMLIRGGLDESRILKVEGYADRNLRNEQNSYAAENRRIAIYLKNLVDRNQENRHDS